MPVTVENFIRAETDLYFSAVALKEDGFGKFEHNRELSPIDNQTVIRQNRDTLYSAAVFDLDAGPVTITLPDAGKRFMSLQVINEDHVLAAGDLRAGQATPSPGKTSARATCSSACARWSIPTIRPTWRRSMRCRTRSRSSSQSVRASSKCRTGTRSARRRCVTR